MPEQVYEQELKSLEQEAETAVTQGGERTLCYNIPPHLFMALLGLRCCARAFSSCDEQGLDLGNLPYFPEADISSMT